MFDTVSQANAFAIQQSFLEVLAVEEAEHAFPVYDYVNALLPDPSNPNDVNPNPVFEFLDEARERNASRWMSSDDLMQLASDAMQFIDETEGIGIGDAQAARVGIYQMLFDNSEMRAVIGDNDISPAQILTTLKSLSEARLRNIQVEAEDARCKALAQGPGAEELEKHAQTALFAAGHLLNPDLYRDKQLPVIELERSEFPSECEYKPGPPAMPEWPWEPTRGRTPFPPFP